MSSKYKRIEGLRDDNILIVVGHLSLKILRKILLNKGLLVTLSEQRERSHILDRVVQDREVFVLFSNSRRRGQGQRGQVLQGDGIVFLFV